MRLLSVDPGEVHCGMAYFEDSADAWHVVSSWEATPEECFEQVVGFMRDDLEVLVVEGFWLYPWKSEEQAFGQVKTVEIIGVLRYLHGKAVENGRDIEWVEQKATIKKPTAAICNAKGIKTYPRSNGHMKDAQLHGWYHILRKLEGEEIPVGQ